MKEQALGTAWREPTKGKDPWSPPAAFPDASIPAPGGAARGGGLRSFRLFPSLLLAACAGARTSAPLPVLQGKAP